MDRAVEIPPLKQECYYYLSKRKGRYIAFRPSHEYVTEMSWLVTVSPSFFRQNTPCFIFSDASWSSHTASATCDCSPETQSRRGAHPSSRFSRLLGCLVGANSCLFWFKTAMAAKEKEGKREAQVAPLFHFVIQEWGLKTCGMEKQQVSQQVQYQLMLQIFTWNSYNLCVLKWNFNYLEVFCFWTVTA